MMGKGTRKREAEPIFTVPESPWENQGQSDKLLLL